MSIQYTMICLHGLGASGDNLKPIAQALNLPNIRFIFPQAPTLSVTLNQGRPMPAWYDIKNSDFSSALRSDANGVDNACATIKALIADEQARYAIPPERVFLMGFSQGGSIALELGLHAEEKLAGIIGLSTLLAKAEKTLENLSPANRDTPIFLAHGSRDSVVPFSVGEHIQRQLQEKNYRLAWVSAAEEHTIWTEEITALRQWLLTIISAE